MKKLYRKTTVHPTPSAVSDQILSFLPAAILALTAALSPEDREVLAYLISCSSASFSNGNRRSKQKPVAGGDHQACFDCNCFRCYMSYWVKWDVSPNRELIHEVIDAFEETLSKQKNRKERRKGKTVQSSDVKVDEAETSPVKEDAAEDGGDEAEEGSVRRFVSFVGERIWGVWG